MNGARKRTRANNGVEGGEGGGMPPNEFAINLM